MCVCVCVWNNLTYTQKIGNKENITEITLDMALSTVVYGREK